MRNMNKNDAKTDKKQALEWKVSKAEAGEVK
jgi:hypothetical protein